MLARKDTVGFAMPSAHREEKMTPSFPANCSAT
jgi:hypothetical protein